MTDRLQSPRRRRVSDLARRPVPRAHRDRQPRRPRQGQARRRRDHQPHDLRRGPRRRRAVRRPGPRAGRRTAPTSTQVDLRAHHRGRPRRLRRARRRSHERRRRRTAGSRSRSSPAWPTTPRAPIALGPAALWRAVDRPNVLIKIPATDEGLPAITAAIAEGISVNVTLIFGLDRYRAVMDAYLAGLEQARDSGHRPVARSTRSPRSSSPASTPRSTSGSTRSAPTRRSR